MRTSHLKFYLLAIWATVGILAAGLVFWALTSPDAHAMFGMGASLPPTATLTPTLPPKTPTLSPTPTRTGVIPTRNPSTLIPIPATNTIPPMAKGESDGSGPAGFDPLTGLKPDDPSRLERRPIAVKISTFPRSLRAYQSGLTLADVVYEYYIEDGLTRFIAVFYGKDAARAGPVRSGRYFDEHVMRMYHSSLVYADADKRVEDYLFESGDLKPYLFLPREGSAGNCPPLCRDDSIPASAGGGYNNVFVNTAGVGAFLADNSRQFLRFMNFFGTYFAFSAQKIDRIYTHYSSYSYNYWEYDPQQARYLRYSDAGDSLDGQGETYAAHIDQLTHQQIKADNVVVLMVPHNFKNAFDRADQVFDIQLFGSGNAYVFSNGLMYKGSWVRDKVDQAVQLFNEKNIPIRLKPGETFYQVIDPESSMSQNDTNVNFNFFIPPRVLTPTPTETRVKQPTPTRRSHE